jgi:aldehyde dehydrogenase (NAD+)
LITTSRGASGLSETWIKSRYEPFIGGESVDTTDGSFVTVNPSTGEPLADVARCTPEVVDRAVSSAQEALSGWSSMKPADRGRVMLGLAAAIRENADWLARLETLDTGQPLRTSYVDVDITARYFEYYGGAADKVHGTTIPLGPGYVSFTTQEPFGVVGMILPWNAPMSQAGRSLGPVLAMGNTTVVKPAEDTSLSTLALAELCATNGLPPGVFNVVTGYGYETGQALSDHPLVRKLSFTGSVETGTKIMQAAARRLVPVALELGGKSPNIVFEDADLDEAIEGAWRAFTLKSGQVCSGGTRLLVQASIYQDFVERLASRVRRASIGPGVDDAELGPMTTKDQFDKVLGYLELGVAEGGRVVVGGGVPDDVALRGGYFLEPTVLADVDNSMRVAQEEIFGPVVCAIKFTDEAEAIRIANDTTFGLAAGIWTRDLSRALRVASAMESGQVYVNEYFAGGVETPFGGFKSSGIGREKGFQALHEYSQTRTVTMKVQSSATQLQSD